MSVVTLQRSLVSSRVADWRPFLPEGRWPVLTDYRRGKTRPRGNIVSSGCCRTALPFVFVPKRMPCRHSQVLGAFNRRRHRMNQLGSGAHARGGDAVGGGLDLPPGTPVMPGSIGYPPEPAGNAMKPRSSISEAMVLPGCIACCRV